MARYIDADKLKEYLHREDFYTPDERWKPESEFVNMIDATPTADVEEVVRCKDCKSVFHDKETNLYWCAKMNGKSVEKDHFCSYGERRDT